MLRRYLFFLLLLFPSLVFCQEKEEEKNAIKVINSISFEGLRKTKEAILLREIPFDIGDTLNLDYLDNQVIRASLNIKNLNLFVSVVGEIVDLDPINVNINFIVKENWHFYVLPTFQLADRNFNEWWYDRGHDFKRVTYGLNIVHYNLTGNKDKLKIKVSEGFVPSYELSYSRPYINKEKTIGLSSGIYYAKRRSVAYRTFEDKLDFFDNERINKETFGGSIEGSYRKSLYTNHRVGVSFAKTQISDTIKTINPNYLDNNQNTLSAISLYYAFNYDTRDSRQYPLNGNYFGFSISKSGLGVFKDVNQASFYAVYAHYFPITKKLFIDTSLRGLISTPKNQPYLYTNAIGYQSTQMRGLELYVIDGQHLGIFKSTAKYQLLNKTLNLNKFIKADSFNSLPIAVYLTSFLDLGYARNFQTELSPTIFGNKLVNGRGIGIDVITWYNTIISTNYSFNNKDKGKFFFSISRSLDKF